MSHCFRAAHLAHVHLVSVFARRGAVGGEDGCAVAVGVPVDHTDGIIQGVRLQNHQHRPEDLFSVALHVRLPEQKHWNAAALRGDFWGTETPVWRHAPSRCRGWWDPQSSRSRNLWLWRSGRPAAASRPGPRRSGSDCRLSPWLVVRSEAQHLPQAGLLTGSKKKPTIWWHSIALEKCELTFKCCPPPTTTPRHSLKNGYLWVSCLLIQILVTAINQSQFYLKLTFFLKGFDPLNQYLGLRRRSGHKFAAWLTQQALAV